MGSTGTGRKCPASSCACFAPRCTGLNSSCTPFDRGDNALIQYEAMLRLCVEQGIARYNFYGIDGVFDDPNSEGRGVLEFKQGFNGYVEELPGEFMRVLRPAIYRLEQFVPTVRSRR